MEQQESKKPSGWWYLLGALLAAAGVAVFVVLRISSTDPDFRLVLPGSKQIELDKGEYTLFYEYKSVFGESTFSTDATVPGIRFFVMAPDQSGIELTVLSVNEKYKFKGREGYSVVKFTVESPGTYTVGGGYPDGPLGAIFIFALGKSSSGSVILAVISIVGGVGTSAVLVAVTFMMRRPGRRTRDPSADS